MLIGSAGIWLNFFFGERYQAWQTVLWTAYQLKDHALTEPIVALPIFRPNPQPGPHKVASFEVPGS
jgi:hypothetical protein